MRDREKGDRLNYQIHKDSVLFICDGIDGNEKFRNTAAADVINNLLLELSKGHAVFFAAYRLPDECVEEIFDAAVIIERAQVLLDPFHTFFHFREAKVNVANMFWAVEGTLYFFEEDVKWTDFLASSEIEDSKLQKLLKSGKLHAYFQMYDHVSVYRCECGRAYEEGLRQFFEDMANAGYRVGEGKDISKYSYEYNM